MSYEKTSAGRGEETVLRCYLHWIGYVPAFIILTAGILTRSVPILAWTLFFTAAVLFAREFVQQATTEILLTNRRIVHKRGWISRNTVELNSLKIEGVDIDQSLIGRLLGYGNIRIRGTGSGIIDIHRICDPIDLRRRIELS